VKNWQNWDILLEKIGNFDEKWVKTITGP